MLHQVQSHLRLRATKLNAWSSWLLDFVLGLCEQRLEVLLNRVSKPSSNDARDKASSSTYLKFCCQGVHVTAILIVLLRITPDEADLFSELIPVLEITDAGRRRTAMLPACALRYTLEAHWMFY